MPPSSELHAFAGRQTAKSLHALRIVSDSADSLSLKTACCAATGPQYSGYIDTGEADPIPVQLCRRVRSSCHVTPAIKLLVSIARSTSLQVQFSVFAYRFAPLSIVPTHLHSRLPGSLLFALCRF
jgi:hypothetical protein